MSAIELTDDEITRLRKGEQIRLQRPLDPQPPSIEAVKKRTGARFSVYQWRPGKWDIGGPVGVVRDMMGCRPAWECPLATVGDVVAVQGSSERCRVVAVEADEVDGVWMWTATVETTTPTAPGWYWFRWNDRTGEHVAWVGSSSTTPGALTVSFVGMRTSMDLESACKHVEWLGAVEPLGVR